jgi:predicted permease
MANWLILRPIPGVRDESTLVTIRIATASNGTRSPMYAVDIDRLAASMPALTGLAGYADIGNFLSATAGLRNEVPARVETELVTASYFPVLGVPLELGRSFTDEEGRSPGAAPVAIVSDVFFRTTLHGDAHLIGQPFVVNGRNVTLIGVATTGFRGTRRASPIDLWLPAAQHAIATPSRATTFFALAGRRRADAPFSVVQDQLHAAEIAIAPPGDQRLTGRRLVATRGLEPVDFEQRALRGTFALLMAFSGLLFLLACANVSNANLARAAAHRGEIATRLALGASRLGVARMLFVDSLVPAVLSGMAALLVARLASVALDGTSIMIDAAPLQHVELDWRVLSVGVALAMLAAVATGMWPMLAGARTGVASVMRDAGGAQTSGRQRLARVLMAAQITLSFVLVAGAVLLARSMYARLSVNPGFDDSRVLTFSVDPLALTGRDAAPIYRSLVDRLRDVPGARAATRAFLPPFYSGVESRLSIRTATDARNLVVGLNYVEPGFFDAIGLPIVAGRDFTTAERNGTGPAKATPLVIGEWLAHRLFGDRPAVGEFLTQYDGTKRLILGVVRDARHRRLLDDNSAEMAFQPFQDNMTTPLVTFVVGFSQPADTMWPSVRHAIARVDPALPIFNAKTAREGIRAEFAEDFLIMRLTLVFGALALLVAASGVYSVLARRVGERQRELGIRAALGAGPRTLSSLVIVETSVILVAGVALGAGACGWLTRYIQSRLYGVSRFDITTFVLAAAIVVATLLVASLPASRRAARTDPARVLKS